MSLGPQCQACRRRRVRCDSRTPSCTKCITKGIECPGYAELGALRWRHCLPRERMPQSLSRMDWRREDDIAPAHVVQDVISYYNSVIALDCSAQNEPNTFGVRMEDWSSFGLVRRHLYACVVLLHKAVRRSAPTSARNLDSNFMNLFYHHQANAANLLTQQISHVQGKPKISLFENVIAFMSSQIQQSAYGSWRAHLNGAKALLGSISGSHPLKLDEINLFAFMSVDIFGQTTAPATLMADSTVSQYCEYLRCIGNINFDTVRSLVPVPDELLLAVTVINLRRAGGINEEIVVIIESRGIDASPFGILHYLETFDPEAWSARVCNQFPQDHVDPGLSESWRLLATSFQAAAVLYLILSDANNGDAVNPMIWDEAFATAYLSVVSSIRALFSQRDEHVRYKYAVWPMVLAGLAAAIQTDETEVIYLVNNLRLMALELGALALLDAAQFLQTFWDKHFTLQIDYNTGRHMLNWNELFADAPLFIM